MLLHPLASLQKGVVPPGGAAGQYLQKSLSSDYALQWSTINIGGLVPYVGANANLNLGTHGLTAGDRINANYDIKLNSSYGFNGQPGNVPYFITSGDTQYSIVRADGWQGCGQGYYWSNGNFPTDYHNCGQFYFAGGGDGFFAAVNGSGSNTNIFSWNGDTGGGHDTTWNGKMTVNALGINCTPTIPLEVSAAGGTSTYSDTPASDTGYLSHTPITPGSCGGYYYDTHAGVYDLVSFYDDSSGNLISNNDSNTIAYIDYAAGYFDSTGYYDEAITYISYTVTLLPGLVARLNGDIQISGATQSLSNVYYGSGHPDRGAYNSTELISTNDQLKIGNKGDYYGDCGCIFMNRSGQNGPVFYTENGINLIDFGLQNPADKANIRLESRYQIYSHSVAASELQFGPIATHGTPVLYIANDGSQIAAFDGALNIWGTLRAKGGFDVSAQNIVSDTTTGTKLLTATTQKFGIWGASPIVRPSGYTMTYATTSKTNSNLTGQTAVSTTSATQTTPYGYSTLAQANAIPTTINAIEADILNIKQILTAILTDDRLLGLRG